MSASRRTSTTELGPTQEACLRTGWIYHLKTTFGKVWQWKWVTIKTDGTLTVAINKKAKRRTTQTYDLRRDCMHIRKAGQCQHLLPPVDVQSCNLMELLLTGDRRLAFCGATPDESELWYSCIEAARSEVSLPTPRSVLILQKEEEEETKRKKEKEEKGNTWCCGCKRQSSKVKVIEDDSVE